MLMMPAVKLLLFVFYWLSFLSNAYGRRETSPAHVGSTFHSKRRVFVNLLGGSSTPEGEEEKKVEEENKEEERPQETKPAIVVDVTAANFRQEVLESDSPILLDVYADWCGPCKQLTPVLEKVAIASKGQFRLAKLNSDENQELVGILNVTGLPTCFAVNEGTITEKFMGGLPPDQLQSFLDRLVTGYGLRASKQVTDAGMNTELTELTEKLSNYIGMTSLSFSKKEKLKRLVNDAMNDEGVLDPETKSPSAALKLTLSYLKNAAKNIKYQKFRVIKTTSKAFSETLSKSPGCKLLLQAAGFQYKDGDISSNLDNYYELRHSNSGIINYVLIYINDALSRKKYGR